MNGIGGFLRELSVVERVQPESLCQRVDVLDEAVRLHVAGGDCEVGLGADRKVITAVLRQVTGLVDPGLRQLAVSECCDRSALWAALLEDLGVHYRDMVIICRGRAPERGLLRYHRIEQSGPLALVTVTDGADRLTCTFDLDAGQLPMAVPVEIADSFTVPADRPMHGGSSRPRTGYLRTWMRRLFRGPAPRPVSRNRMAG